MPSEMTNAMIKPVEPPTTAPTTRISAESEASRTAVLSRLWCTESPPTARSGRCSGQRRSARLRSGSVPPSVIRQPGCLVHQVTEVSPRRREGRGPEQRVERAHLDADPAVHAQRQVDREPVEHAARTRVERPPGPVGPGPPSRRGPRCRCTSRDTRARRACTTVQLLSSRAMTPRLLSGMLSAGTWFAGSLVGGSLVTARLRGASASGGLDGPARRPAPRLPARAAPSEPSAARSPCGAGDPRSCPGAAAAEAPGVPRTAHRTSP